MCVPFGPIRGRNFERISLNLWFSLDAWSSSTLAPSPTKFGGRRRASRWWTRLWNVSFDKVLNWIESLLNEKQTIFPRVWNNRIVKVRETRITQIISHILIGLSIFLVPYPLAYIPTAVLDGLFLYMAITSLSGNQMFERITLLFMEQVSRWAGGQWFRNWVVILIYRQRTLPITTSGDVLRGRSIFSHSANWCNWESCASSASVPGHTLKWFFLSSFYFFSLSGLSLSQIMMLLFLSTFVENRSANNHFYISLRYLTSSFPSSSSHPHVQTQDRSLRNWCQVFGCSGRRTSVIHGKGEITFHRNYLSPPLTHVSVSSILRESWIQMKCLPSISYRFSHFKLIHPSYPFLAFFTPLQRKQEEE